MGRLHWSGQRGWGWGCGRAGRDIWDQDGQDRHRGAVTARGWGLGQSRDPLPAHPCNGTGSTHRDVQGADRGSAPSLGPMVSLPHDPVLLPDTALRLPTAPSHPPSHVLHEDPAHCPAPQQGRIQQQRHQQQPGGSGTGTSAGQTQVAEPCHLRS